MVMIRSDNNWYVVKEGNDFTIKKYSLEDAIADAVDRRRKDRRHTVFGCKTDRRENKQDALLIKNFHATHIDDRRHYDDAESEVERREGERRKDVKVYSGTISKEEMSMLKPGEIYSFHPEPSNITIHKEIRIKNRRKDINGNRRTNTVDRRVQPLQQYKLGEGTIRSDKDRRKEKFTFLNRQGRRDPWLSHYADIDYVNILERRDPLNQEFGSITDRKEYKEKIAKFMKKLGKHVRVDDVKDYNIAKMSTDRRLYVGTIDDRKGHDPKPGSFYHVREEDLANFGQAEPVRIDPKDWKGETGSMTWLDDHDRRKKKGHWTDRKVELKPEAAYANNIREGDLGRVDRRNPFKPGHWTDRVYKEGEFVDPRKVKVRIGDLIVAREYFECKDKSGVVFLCPERRKSGVTTRRLKRFDRREQLQRRRQGDNWISIEYDRRIYKDRRKDKS